MRIQAIRRENRKSGGFVEEISLANAHCFISARKSVALAYVFHHFFIWAGVVIARVLAIERFFYKILLVARFSLSECQNAA